MLNNKVWISFETYSPHYCFLISSMLTISNSCFLHKKPLAMMTSTVFIQTGSEILFFHRCFHFFGSPHISILTPLPAKSMFLKNPAVNVTMDSDAVFPLRVNVSTGEAECSTRIVYWEHSCCLCEWFHFHCHLLCVYQGQSEVKDRKTD